MQDELMKEQKTKIKAVLFDMGNVLVFFDAKRSSKAFAEAMKCDEEKVWKAFFISDMERAYTRGEISTEEFYKRVKEHFACEIDFETFAELWNDIFTENKELTVLIKKLKQIYPLFLISNTNDLHFEYIRKKFGVLDHFNKCFPSHLVGHRKPDKAMFEHVIKEIGLKPEETVFIDDIIDFVNAAKSTGMNGIQFTTVANLARDLRSIGIKF